MGHPVDMYEPTQEEKYDHYIEMQNHCPLCNSELNIKVTSYLENNTIKEEAYCESCNIKTRSKDHKYH